MIVLKDGRTELHQWDTGRILKVDPDINELHFAKTPMGRSLDVGVSDGEARIPDVLLQTPGSLHIWAFVGSPEDGYTKVSKVITIQPRNKPADYVFTPQEQLTLADIANRVESLEKQIDGDSGKDITAESIETALGYTPADADELNSKLDAVKLPEAINTALAQAKESGEFDGQDGQDGQDGDDYVLTEADKQEIAEEAAKLVDIPDSGTDTSLGITGAAVGQIPKVSAVDESGVPTAWLPADFPSGGGGTNAESVQKVVLTEEVSSVTLSCKYTKTPFNAILYTDIYPSPSNTENSRKAIAFELVSNGVFSRDVDVVPTEEIKNNMPRAGRTTWLFAVGEKNMVSLYTLSTCGNYHNTSTSSWGQFVHNKGGGEFGIHIRLWSGAKFGVGSVFELRVIE